MTSRVEILRAEIEEREQEIAYIFQEEEAARIREEAKAREALDFAKKVRISEEPSRGSVSLIDALDAAIDNEEECIFAVNWVKRAEAKVAEYDGFATMGAYEAQEALEDANAEYVAVQRKFHPSVQNVLIAIRETERERIRYLEKLELELKTYRENERERVRYLEKLGLELEKLKKIIGC